MKTTFVTTDSTGARCAHMELQEHSYFGYSCGRCSESLETPFFDVSLQEWDMAEAFAHNLGWRISLVYQGDAPDNLCPSCASDDDLPFATKQQRIFLSRRPWGLPL